MRILLIAACILALSGCACDRERYRISSEYQDGYRAGLADGAVVNLGIIAIREKKN